MYRGGIATMRCVASDPEDEQSSPSWLILPVVVCLSQRLSHASLCIRCLTVKLRRAQYNSYELVDGATNG